MNLKQITIAEISSSKIWKSITVSEEQDPFSITHRFPIGIPTHKDGYKGFLSFQWEYETDDSFRLPTTEEQNIIDEIVCAIKKYFKSNETSFPIAHMTSNGLFQIILMTKHPGDALACAMDATVIHTSINKHPEKQFVVFRHEMIFDMEWEQISTVQSIFSSNYSNRAITIVDEEDL